MRDLTNMFYYQNAKQQEQWNQDYWYYLNRYFNKMFLYIHRWPEMMEEVVALDISRMSETTKVFLYVSIATKPIGEEVLNMEHLSDLRNVKPLEKRIDLTSMPVRHSRIHEKYNIGW